MAFAHFSIELLAFLFFIAIVAGFLDTLAGGGGLLTVPALMMSGIPPVAALATNKLQASTGTATASYMMLKNKKVSWGEIKPLMLFAFIGAATGTVIIQFVDTRVLSFVIPLVVFFIGLYFLVAPALDKQNNQAKVSAKKYQRLVVPSIGCYDGLFGPGTGSFFALAGVSLNGRGFIDATAIAKTLNFSTNIASLLVFLIAGQVVWALGFTMLFGQILGAWLGSHCLFTIKVKYLRYLVVAMCFAMLIKYGFTL
ncbi:TSUP family transporter [Thalassomonas haliotis]|uniref:Probable membrane transporter protein n=1 Tax=Thalassomonas haliotis TaxID=485448 RepID=A0ABY7VEP2_9GAMM|nr:TSUP family transporter [Thalassomonas haliotis]WDE12184.1 TSUP family transporter [Thalassomonas haliotis]